MTFLTGVCTEGIQPTALLLHPNTFSSIERVFLKGFCVGVCSLSSLILKETKIILSFSLFVLFCVTFIMKGNYVVPAPGHFRRKPSMMTFNP